MKRRWIAVLALVCALMMFAPMGSGAFAAVNVQAAEAGKWVSSGGTWYYKDASGNYVKGWREIDGSWYYFNASGAMQTGWVQVGGSWYYMASSGKMKTGWVKDGGSWYYMASSGVMKTGWVQVDGAWYYMGSSGKMQTGWKQIGGSWYYLGTSGKMQTGWVKSGSSWYYLASSGKMQTGWVKVGSDWYHMDEEGKMQTGWFNPDLIKANSWEYEGKTYDDSTYGGTDWYYLKSSGAMATGWAKADGEWYYFRSSGKMYTGWLNLSGKWYYLEDVSVNQYWDDSYQFGEDYGRLQGELPTEAVAYQRIMAMKSDYPEGMHYTNDDYYEWEMGQKYHNYSGGWGCAGFAFMMSDVAYGKLPVRNEDEIDYDKLHVGDILRINGDRHSVVILEIHPSYIVITEANYNSSVHWGRTLTKDKVLQSDYVTTRYPENYK
ncbi:MAG: hypothetical protein IJM26_11165 [Lachnospiraceae bacterium]|nr:hypothetical protein [Lachnospiraceae bacterium]